MLNGYRIIDVDGHVQEPGDIWDRYLEPALLEDAPRNPGGRWFYRGQPTNFKLSEEVKDEFGRKTRANYATELAEGWSPESQLRAMDRMGIDVSFLYPTHGLFVWHIRDMAPATAAGLCRAYNRWLAEFCALAPDRMKPVAALSLLDPAAAVTEAQRAHEEHGVQAVYIRPNPVAGRTIGSADYEPLWSYCERAGIAIGLHEGAHAMVDTIGQDRFESDLGLWCASHPMEMMAAFVSLLEGGIFERHPDLRVGFLEAGCGWVPYWLWRLDERWENTGFEIASRVTMPPSEYFRRQCWVSVEADEPYLGDIIKHIGEDRVLFASDYPHPDHKPDLTGTLVSLEGMLTKATLEKILWDNPRAFYGEK